MNSNTSNSVCRKEGLLRSVFAAKLIDTEKVRFQEKTRSISFRTTKLIFPLFSAICNGNTVNIVVVLPQRWLFGEKLVMLQRH